MSASRVSRGSVRFWVRLAGCEGFVGVCKHGRGSKEGLAKVSGLFVERAGGIKVHFFGSFCKALSRFQWLGDGKQVGSVCRCQRWGSDRRLLSVGEHVCF